ncbi:hypothetical protein E2C01_083573 [Portunus trituberculatus]|uniref:Uncharacterized protein n=1 Tax=Portunus trituberculatus TaxID=210409 RepID=A0A5B7J3V6_PORTR|nr:hypothetical protein [Portunus trituberculatus]
MCGDYVLIRAEENDLPLATSSSACPGPARVRPASPSPRTRRGSNAKISVDGLAPQYTVKRYAFLQRSGAHGPIQPLVWWNVSRRFTSFRQGGEEAWTSWTASLSPVDSQGPIVESEIATPCTVLLARCYGCQRRLNFVVSRPFSMAPLLSKQLVPDGRWQA